MTLVKGLVAAAVGTCAVALLAALPARQVLLPASGPKPVRGVMHIHTRDSDGTGTVDDVAAAAARAGLSFVVITDHGDATRLPPPSYRSGVLCISATEVSTFTGHVIALGMPQAPFPLAGEPRDVIDDIHRLGGLAIVAHPHSKKLDLRWSDLDAPFDGIEWLNADSEWRDERLLDLVRVLSTYWFRAPEALATMLDRTNETLQLWDQVSKTRPVVGVAGSDAHARLGEDRIYLRLPSYEAIFRTFSLAVTGVSLRGDAVADADAVIRAIRAGHVYSAIDGLATPAHLEFSAERAGARVDAGERLGAGGPVTFTVRTNAPSDAAVTLVGNGRRIAAGRAPVFSHTEPAPAGAYRVEVTLNGVGGEPPVPWVVSNPIYVGTTARTIGAEAAPTDARFLYRNGPAAEWTVEHSPRARGAVSVIGAVGGTQVLFRFALGGSTAESPFVALAMPAGSDVTGHDRLAFSGRANRPMRVSVQLRATRGGTEHRWRRSVYLDEEARLVTLPLSDFRPTTPATPAAVDLPAVTSILFVVDQVNTKLGTSGQIWLDDVRYQREGTTSGR